MMPYDMVEYNGRLYCIHSFKMNREYVVLNAMDKNEHDYETIHIRNLKELGMTISDVPGCTTLDDVKKMFPQFMV